MSRTNTQKSQTPPTSFLKEHPDTLRMTAPRRARFSRGFWTLFALGAALNIGVLAIGATIFFSEAKKVEPPESRRIDVPFGKDRDVWNAVREWPVQEDGRVKPLDTFCREAVFTITGRTFFEGNDPVGVVMSWLLTWDEDDNQAWKNARQAGCEWDEYPFILCDYHELRALLYREKQGDNTVLSEEELHGKYVEPKLLRESKEFKRVLQQGMARKAEDNKAFETKLEKKAQEVKKRLALFDRIRAGGQEGRESMNAPGELGMVCLDKHSKAWFSYRAVREFGKTPFLWAESMGRRRIHNGEAYAGQPPQDLPLEECGKITNAFATMRQAYLGGDAEKFTEAAGKFHTTVETVSSSFGSFPGVDTIALEMWFNKASPFRKAWITSLLATILILGAVAVTRRWPLLSQTFYIGGLLAYAGALLWSGAGFYCRVAISGRPPVSNMYESIIWVGFMAAVFGLVLELVFRTRLYALTGALVSTIGLVLADQLPNTFTHSIQPLVAVLRSNYWLVIHVLTIVSSYAAFALAWGIGNINLGLMLFAPHRHDLIKDLSRLCYKAIQIGVVLIAAGTLLGGFWAAESWGRFWGWDPKEVWALIALLCYVIPLHARFVGWVKDFGLAACSVVCFASVVMAWYGVNYVLGAGLHSYGFGGGNDIWVYWGGLINISLVVHAGLRYHYWQPEMVD